MDAEAPAPLGDPHQRVQEVGKLRSQRGELVHHDNQPRERLVSGTAPGPEGGKVLRSRSPESLLAVAQLGLKTHQRPLGQAVIEVGHHPGDVWHLGAPVEGRAALVVDEHQGDVVGISRHRQPGH